MGMEIPDWEKDAITLGDCPGCEEPLMFLPSNDPPAKASLSDLVSSGKLYGQALFYWFALPINPPVNDMKRVYALCYPCYGRAFDFLCEVLAKPRPSQRSPTPEEAG